MCCIWRRNNAIRRRRPPAALGWTAWYVGRAGRSDPTRREAPPLLPRQIRLILEHRPAAVLAGRRLCSVSFGRARARYTFVKLLCAPTTTTGGGRRSVAKCALGASPSAAVSVESRLRYLSSRPAYKNALFVFIPCMRRRFCRKIDVCAIRRLSTGLTHLLDTGIKSYRTY